MERGVCSGVLGYIMLSFSAELFFSCLSKIAKSKRAPRMQFLLSFTIFLNVQTLTSVGP